ncbi:MAG: PhzF family phenazine biosynthesis isomerase [Coprobacillaceae bacterium]
MKEVMVHHVDAFSTVPSKGNPAGVIVNGDAYTTSQMQEIARQVGFNECVFICESEVADIKLRYFTPGHEMPLCGHATTAAIYMLLKDTNEDKIYTIETMADILSVSYYHQNKEIEMQHATPEFIPFTGDKESLCQSINIHVEQLHPSFPILYGSTGTWTLLIPVLEEAVLDVMKPNTETFPSVLKEKPRCSLHPFALTSKDKCFSARHFSSPYSGTTEDPVTGTASGVMGAYALDYLYPKEESLVLTIFQGKHLNKDGKLKVIARRNENGHDICIRGTAVYNKEIPLTI